MANSIKGHLLKYKLKDGTWVTLPLSVINVYDIYTTYCAENNITPVDKTTYFQTLGNLENLVSELAGSTDAIEQLTTALAGGVLPVTKGGTGCSSEQNLINYLTTGLGLVTASQAENTAVAYTDSVVKNKLDANKIAHGTKAPAEAGLGSSVMYYFQYV